MRALKSLLALSLLFSTLFLMAVPTQAFSGVGTGDSDDPFQITTCLQLQEMNDDIDADYLLMNDINCGEGAPAGNDTREWNVDPDDTSEYLGFEPIGNFEMNEFFTGGLDGNDKTITGLYIRRPNEYTVGLFDVVAGSTINDLTLNDLSIEGGYFIGGLSALMVETELTNIDIGGDSEIVLNTSLDPEALPYPPSVGGMVGYFVYSTVFGGFSTAQILGYTEGVYGGLVGINGGYIVFSGVEANLIALSGYVGGLVGVNEAGFVGGSYSEGYVIATEGYIGGFAGFNLNQMTDNYTLSNVAIPTHFDGGYVGGFTGYNSGGEIEDSYTAGQVIISSYDPGDEEFFGAFVGNNGAEISQSFWNTDTAGSWSGCGAVSGEDCSGVMGKNNAEMRSLSTFTTDLDDSWDFETIWGMNDTDNDGYPFFLWQGFESDPEEEEDSDPTPTPTPTAGPSSTESTINNEYRPPECTDQLPGGVPGLFRVDRAGDEATLWIEAGGDPYNGLVVWYGVDQNTNQFADSFSVSHADGMIQHVIASLDPAATYSFKVQAAHGCAHSAFSQTITSGPGNNVSYTGTQSNNSDLFEEVSLASPSAGSVASGEGGSNFFENIPTSGQIKLPDNSSAQSPIDQFFNWIKGIFSW